MRTVWLLLCATTVFGQVLQKDCDYGGTIYNSGHSFLDSDGCNNCFCSDGAVACTLKWCPPPSTSDCTYGGVDYKSGATFNALDGCNSCGCFQGKVSCTEMIC